MGLKKKSQKKKKSDVVATHAKGNARAKQILEIIASDNIAYVGLSNPPVYVTRCLHCNSPLYVTMSGRTDATVEHIVPLCAGGGVDLLNLALACKACNNEKGVRHDPNYPQDPRSVEVINNLLARRKWQYKQPV